VKWILIMYFRWW